MIELLDERSAAAKGELGELQADVAEVDDEIVAALQLADPIQMPYGGT